ncbi:hypothetical protein ISS08_00195 [Candidatus Pacearchaeota archaeon]|nr:hypothetical protein [Candidatus Pacearchaeota archaeon]
MGDTLNKRGQVTIFIVVAIVIIAIAALLYLFSPSVKSIISPDTQNPEEFIREYLQEEIEMNIQTIAMQGGSYDLENIGTANYGEYEVSYLCYTEDPAPLKCSLSTAGNTLIPYIEREIKNSVEPLVDSSFDALKKSYEEEGYSVDIKPGDIEVIIVDKQIKINMDYKVRLEKENIDEYEQFNILVNTNLFQLLIIATNILQYEASVGVADPNRYLNSEGPKGFIWQKELLADGTKIYELENIYSEDKFQFAVKGGL